MDSSTTRKHDQSLPLRFAFYGRYSGELQRQSSIEDQLRSCREAATRLGGQIIDAHVYFDEAETGQAQAGRAGLQRLMTAVKSRIKLFEGILIDDTSRFGRNLSHVLPMSDIILARGIYMYFAAQGLDSRFPNFRDLLIMYGQQDERYSKSLGEKTHRGQRGRALKGLLPSGRAYGYDRLNIEHPWRKAEYGRPAIEGVRLVVNPEQAEVLRRIFRLYVDGLGTTQIAALLNKEKIPSPLQGTGTKYRSWRSNTVKKMLRNERYIGVSLWNRTKTVIDPETDQVKHPPRPKQEWQRVDVPATYASRVHAVGTADRGC